MSNLAKFKPSAPQTDILEPVKAQSDDYKGIVVDDKFTPVASMVRYMEGYPLTVTYYGQLVGQDNNLREVDPAQSSVYQQYRRINGLEIRVDTPLDMNYDSETGKSEVSGSANIYAGVVPNTFDYITFPYTGGRLGLFKINNVRRQGMNRESVHAVDYQFVGYVDDPDIRPLYDSLVAKVKREYYFDGSRLAEGNSAILRDGDYQNITNLTKAYGQIVEYYFDTFFNRTYQTLVLPAQSASVYDKFLVDYLMTIVDGDDHPKVMYTKRLGVDRDRYFDQPQFWKAVAERNPLFITQANKYMTLISRGQFLRNSTVAGAFFSTIGQYVYPSDADLSTIISGDPLPKDSVAYISSTLGYRNSIAEQALNDYTVAGSTIPLYKSILVDHFYVLSMDFYENEQNWSLLEKVTWDYLKGSAIQLVELSALVKQYYVLPRLEQFYYGPLLLTFIKNIRSAQYTSF